MGRIAFLFAGQGAQSVGMGADLYENYAEARQCFERLTTEEREICFLGPAESLNQTRYTQPCLYAMDLACARVLEAKGIRAEAVAGFSLGEIPALAFAGRISEEDGMRLVRKRGEAMQECAEKHPGAMIVVLRLNAEQVEGICGKLIKAYPVNYNCPGQTVVACAEESVEALTSEVTGAGGRAMRLPVSGAFHSPFMQEASDALQQYVPTLPWTEAALPVYANTTAGLYTDPKLLVPTQVINPVRWQESMERMIADGYDTFFEVGAGKTLSGLLGKISKEVRVVPVNNVETLEAAVQIVK